MDLSALPALNAALNAVAAALLLRGRWLIRRGHVDAHRRTMLAAFAVSSLFLALYVLHKAARGFESLTFHAEGLAKAAYLALLASHVVLAMAVPVLALSLIAFGLRGRIARHRRLARVAWPIWMYVSVTGILIYLLLYHWNPAPFCEACGSRGLGLNPAACLPQTRPAAVRPASPSLPSCPGHHLRGWIRMSRIGYVFAALLAASSLASAAAAEQSRTAKCCSELLALPRRSRRGQSPGAGARDRRPRGWYIEAQLGFFRNGGRGDHPQDIPGLRMRPMSRSLMTTPR